MDLSANIGDKEDELHLVGKGRKTMGGGLTMMILFIIALGVIFYLLVNQQDLGNERNLKSQPVMNINVLELLNSRLAKGEITIEEYEQIKKNILSE